MAGRVSSLAVNAVTYTCYDLGVGLQDAKDYLAVSVGDGPDAWNALATDALKSKFIVQAFRYLEQRAWQGTANAPTVAQWPRTGVVDRYSATVDPTTVPIALVQAQYELAAILAADATVLAALNSGSNVHRVDAKGVAVQFFRPTNTPGGSTPLPVVVQRLAGQFLASAVANAAAGAYVQANDADDDGDGADDDIESAFADEAIMDRVGPLV